MGSSCWRKVGEEVNRSDYEVVRVEEDRVFIIALDVVIVNVIFVVGFIVLILLVTYSFFLDYKEKAGKWK